MIVMSINNWASTKKRKALHFGRQFARNRGASAFCLNGLNLRWGAMQRQLIREAELLRTSRNKEACRSLLRMMD
jgi:hypothetical protein